MQKEESVLDLQEQELYNTYEKNRLALADMAREASLSRYYNRDSYDELLEKHIAFIKELDNDLYAVFMDLFIDEYGVTRISIPETNK